ncbi:ubiquitin carboxyl-terminal hydrolase 12-like [Durio zibethinus]|uniref:Ubiquitin carboxyl-terminal hydrolase 12-like n=1 Tax=Durio zibethinus TaxID=66656 RepID=A0A6P6BEJ6_DURZI|nr:ubiquitin carboxyl-terminal hydrolase 12-like [Durio zibethinus]
MVSKGDLGGCRVAVGWRLSLYPNGNKKSNGFGFISLYLQIEETENLPRTWEVNANFRFCCQTNINWRSLTKDPPNNTITFTLQNYSKSYSDFYVSDAQTIGDSNWKLHVYPRGGGSWKNIALSVYLELVEARSFPPKRKVYAQYKLRVKDGYNSNNNRENTASIWYTAESFSRGYRYFMSLLDLQDKSKGYIVNDTLIVEAEILIVSKVKLFL